MKKIYLIPLAIPPAIAAFAAWLMFWINRDIAGDSKWFALNFGMGMGVPVAIAALALIVITKRKP